MVGEGRRSWTSSLKASLISPGCRQWHGGGPLLLVYGYFHRLRKRRAQCELRPYRMVKNGDRYTKGLVSNECMCVHNLDVPRCGALGKIPHLNLPLSPYAIERTQEQTSQWVLLQKQRMKLLGRKSHTNLTDLYSNSKNVWRESTQTKTQTLTFQIGDSLKYTNT